MAKSRKLALGDPAPSGMCLDKDGQPVALSTLWAGGPILLTFLRHFG
jgi:hypothetical protein